MFFGIFAAMCGVFPFLLLSVSVIPDTRVLVINVKNEKANNLVIF